MLKKILISVVMIIVMLTTVASAIEIGDDFYLYGRDDKKLSDLLGMSESELEKYCKDNYITLLAVNSDNTRQIREITRETEFSKTVKSLAALSDDEIKALTFQLCGLENVKGEIIEKDAYKFLKIEVKGADSGGEYILTQYITVKDSKSVTLSFYTSKSGDTSYVDEIFNSRFGEKSSASRGWVTAGLVVFVGVAVVLAFMIIRDIKPPKTRLEALEEDEEQGENQAP